MHAKIPGNDGRIAFPHQSRTRVDTEQNYGTDEGITGRCQAHPQNDNEEGSQGSVSS